MQVRACVFPKESQLANEAVSAGFRDSYVASPVVNAYNLIEIYRLMVNNTPAWINFLLTVRNKIVGKLGLIDVGNLGGVESVNSVNSKNLVGMKLDIFTIKSLDENEMILILDDKHLDIKLSILKLEYNSQTSITVSTIVHFHNYFGKMYMLTIKPFHKIIVKRLLSNLSQSR